MSSNTRARAKRWAGYVASVGIVAWLLLVVLPHVGDVEGAGELLRARLGVRDVAMLAALLAVHFLAYGMTLSTAVPGLPAATAVAVRVVSGGVGRVLPFGWAVGAAVLVAMLRVRGVALGAAGRALAVTGTWNFLTKLSLPLLAGVAVTGWKLPADARAWATGGLLLAALAAGVLFVRLLLDERVGRRAGRLAERLAGALARWSGHSGPQGLAGQVAGFQRTTANALRERPAAMAGWYMAYHLTHAALLWAALIAVADPAGVRVTWPEAFAAFAAGYLLTGLPFTPGGIGAFDVVVIGGLTLAGEDPDVATAAVGLFRIATYAVYAPAAVAAWPTWRRLKASGQAYGRPALDASDGRGGCS